RARSDSEARVAGSSNRRASASPSSAASDRATSSAASPATSGIDVTAGAMTAQPLAIASSTVSPKPSYSDAVIAISAAAYSARRASSSSGPSQRAPGGSARSHGGAYPGRSRPAIASSQPRPAPSANPNASMTRS